LAKDRLHIVMEYAEAGDLWRLLHKQHPEPWPEEVITGFFIQLCLAVKFVHDKNILHRDIKPPNIFLTKVGVLKLGDFGIARVLQSTQSMARTQVGTPYYSAPELCHGLSYGKKADVWALGCVLFEMCAHEPPFYARTIGEVTRKIMYGTFPAQSVAGFHPEIRRLIGNMLSKRPAQRPSTHRILQNPFLQQGADTALDPLSAFIARCFKEEKAGKMPAAEAEQAVDAAAKGEVEMIPKPEAEDKKEFQIMRATAKVIIQEVIETPAQSDPMEDKELEAEYDKLIESQPTLSEQLASPSGRGHGVDSSVVEVLQEADRLGVGADSEENYCTPIKLDPRPAGNSVFFGKIDPVKFDADGALPSPGIDQVEALANAELEALEKQMREL